MKITFRTCCAFFHEAHASLKVVTGRLPTFFNTHCLFPCDTCESQNGEWSYASAYAEFYVEKITHVPGALQSDGDKNKMNVRTRLGGNYEDNRYNFDPRRRPLVNMDCAPWWDPSAEPRGEIVLGRGITRRKDLAQHFETMRMLFEPGSVGAVRRHQSEQRQLIVVFFPRDTSVPLVLALHPIHRS